MSTTPNSSTNTAPKISLNQGIKLIRTFNGEKTKLYEFIENAEMALSLVSDSEKTVLLSFIKGNILDRARAQIRNRDFPDWESLKSFLLESYSDVRSHAQYQLELNCCRQQTTENVTSYSNKIETLLLKLCNSLDEKLTDAEKKANVKLLQTQARNVFVAGLNRELEILVKAQNPKSLEEAISLAQAEEVWQTSKVETRRFSKGNNSNNSNHSNHSNHSKPGKKFCAYCKRDNHNVEECFRKPSPAKTFPVRAMEVKKSCNYCKKEGHTIDECRRRAYNNARKEKGKEGDQNPKQSTFTVKSLNSQEPPRSAAGQVASRIVAELSKST